ncbi:extracellular solute-binding protein [Paenibacillus psychroresistens]|uniref:Extracellular solute-binding protein n=1 Tax=Paenibacillus psychroresistens TaxID=1778678 RepID=A0A6B8RSF9_9BACL|nr:ABC transporter substrate-binding protein [Paenibacillus psychroresistens]QGQ98754.1 extracellular solute-binding protein [Paenibacillus psychroresistens]
MLKGSKFSKVGIVATIMVLVLSMLLSACSKKEATTETPAASVAATAAATAAPAESAAPAALPEVKLTWYFPGNFPQPEQDKVFEEVNKVLKEKINTTVDFKPVGFGEYEQKMQVVIASGEAYDLAFTSNWINNYTSNVAKGAFLPLDDLLVKYAPKSFASVPEAFWTATKVKGKIYGFVNQQISARTPDVVIPKSLVDKYQLDTSAISGKLSVDNLSALEPFIQAVTKDDPKKPFITALSQFGDGFNFETIAGMNVPGAVVYTDDTLKVVNQYESAEVMKFAALMRDWNKKGYLNASERIAKKLDNSQDDLKAGKAGVIIGGAYKPGVEVVMAAQAGYPTVDIPAGQAHLTTGGIIATMHAINRNSKNPERAMMLLELLNTDADLYNLLNFGIKDNHFKIDADGFMVPGDNSKAYAPNVPWMFATNYLAFVDKGMPKTVWEDTKKVNADAVPSKLLGFTFDGTPVKAEIAKTSAVYDEYYRAIELGVASEAKYTEFVAKLKTAGSDKVIAEMQAQIDAWKATK